MAVDIFLKIDGIDGESTDVHHKDEIEVVSWSWGVEQTPPHATGGGAAGKPHVADLAVVKYVDKASPSLFRHCVKGAHIASAVLEQRKSGAGSVSFLAITLDEVLVTAVSDASDGSRPTERVSLAFAKVAYTYTPLKPNGQPDTPVTFKWNVKTNQEL